MPITRSKIKTRWLPPFAFLAASKPQQGPTRYSTAQEEEARVTKMYAMHAIGVELVAMFENKNIKPKRLRELVTLLDEQAKALPQHF